MERRNEDHEGRIKGAGMSLPAFSASGELPAGVHQADLGEVLSRFGGGTPARRRCTAVLRHVLELAARTGELDRLVVFGSYVTDKPAPNDVDVVLIMNRGFEPDDAPEECRVLFDHLRAQQELGASVFWVTPANIIGMTLAEFIQGWQLTREKTLRGIVEITDD
jgi:hypothetical protein